MNEEEATHWIQSTLNVPCGTIDLLTSFAAAIVQGNSSQNLIGASTISDIWLRHIVDSAQLILHAPSDGRWIDVGSGAGLPGLVVGIIARHSVTLVESRPKRAGFLKTTAEALGLTNVNVICAPIEKVTMASAAVLSARAVAPLDRLFGAAVHLADPNTVWLLPKGRMATSELATARKSWQGVFTMKPSVTDPEAAIIVARDVNRRPRA